MVHRLWSATDRLCGPQFLRLCSFLCAMCTFYATVRAYKNLWHSFKKFQNAYKNHLTNACKSPKLGHFVVFTVFGNMPKTRKIWAFCILLHSSHRIQSLKEAWSRWQVWTLCVCVHITMWMGVNGLFCGRPVETPGLFHDQILWRA